MIELIVLSAMARQDSPKTFSLADLDLKAVSQDYGYPAKNKSVDGNPISIGGRVFSSGLGSHAKSMLRLTLDRKVERFTAWVGVNDESGQKGSVQFIVRLDGRKAFDSGLMRGSEAAKRVELSLRGVRRMQLFVEDAGDGIDHDHADWAEAVFELGEGKVPVAEVFRPEPTMPIATKIPERARFNGPRVVGTTPGKPFLYRVPVSGVRPIKLEATGLPDGLKLGSDGVISGAVSQPGTYRVRLSAGNRAGTDTRELTIRAGKHMLAATPPMGWNSWNVWGTDVDADKVRAAARSMVDTGLADFGFQYVNIDDAWEDKRNEEGVLLTNAKFPDMPQLAREVHGLGLKLGIYSSPGPKTCAGYEGSWQHEQIDADTWAAWGIDYLKYDWCSYGGIAKSSELHELQRPYKMMREALDNAPRDIVYSLCQYGMGKVWEWGDRVGGDVWRTTGDIVDTWSSMAGIGFAQLPAAKYSGPSSWNDPDMMVLGKVGWSKNIRPNRLSGNEQITHMTLWTMLASPLILGCDLTQLDGFTKALLTNHDVIEINQDPLGRGPKKVWSEGDLEVWTRPLQDGSTAVAMFNRGPEKDKVAVAWPKIGLGTPGRVLDCWMSREEKVDRKGMEKTVPGHGSMLFRVR